MSNILISTIYNSDAVFVACNKLGPTKLYLIATKEKTKVIENSIKLIKDSIGKVMKVQVITADPYDIYKIAKQCTKLIDSFDPKDKIYINITGGRKTQSLALLFAGYARHKYIENIYYFSQEEKKAITMPVLSFNFSPSQRKTLELFKDSKNSNESFTKLAEKVGISRAMFYRNIDELKSMGLISIDDSGITLTESGKISLL